MSGDGHGAYALGIDIGGTDIKLALLNAGREGARHSVIPFSRGALLADYIYDNASEFLGECGIAPAEAAAIGVCIPGRVDCASGHVMYAHNLGLSDAPLGQELEKRFNAKIAYLNDADAAAYAEFKRGALQGTRNSCLITLGTGFGAGIILDGKPFCGGRARGTEFGHTALDMNNAEVCTCGNRGCVEALCSAAFIEKRAIKAYSRGVTAKRVFELAKEGDTAAAGILKEYISNLGSAIASLIAAYDPEVIAIGGGVAAAGDALLVPLRKEVEKKCFFEDAGRLVSAGMGSLAGAIGAGLYAAAEAGLKDV